MTDPNQQVERRKTDCSEHEKRLSNVEHATDSLQILMESVDTKVDKILEKVNRIDLLELKHDTQKDELAKVEQKIKRVSEVHDKAVDVLMHEHNKKFDEISKTVSALALESRQFINETRGMAKMAWIIWTIMGSGLFVMLVKVLFFAAPAAIKIGM